MSENTEKINIKIQQAQELLDSLGFPKAQCNERSALTLLALLDLKPDTPWNQADNPLIGISHMISFCAKHYQKRYAPNTRETIRKYSVHQFLQGGIVVKNPDEPKRPVNSGKTVYRIENAALKMLKTFGTRKWKGELETFLTTKPALQELYSRQRRLLQIPVIFPDSSKGFLSPGGQNPLIKEIIEKFCSRFTPNGQVLYVGDAEEKFRQYFPKELKKLGIIVEEHGKMPDIVVHYREKNWLVLIEAVTSHGPMDIKRHKELMALFRDSKIGLVYVTAFETRQTMKRFLTEIDWETEVWIAESPDHLIHFNGVRFLGPYIK